MARKQDVNPNNKPPTKLSVSRKDAETKINERIEKGNALKTIAISTWGQLESVRNEYYKWSSYNTELLKRLFSDTTLADEYSAFFGAVVGGGPPDLREDIKDLHRDVSEKVHRLDSIKERLELIPEPAFASQFSVKPPAKSIGQKVFVVHGHDEGAREATARFIEKLGLQPIILHEQASGGRTIIEKLEHYADVDFAVILLTPDDVGNSAKATDKLNSRARQNVILELGYFVAKLGRSKVCALHKPGVELPSDFMGVVYTTMDPAGAWQLVLAKELREAGFNVDMNSVL